jgi:DNA topoisomerase-1
MIVTDFLVTNFEAILDYNFTAKVEEDFDAIAEGNEDWIKMIKNFYKDFHLTVEDVKENAERESGERILGKDPKTGKTVLVRLGRFGAMAQIGGREDEDKKFASLNPDQNLTKITLEEALDLFLLPKNLGDYESKEVIVANGRFGPYVKYDAKYVSLPKGENALDVTLERAIELIIAKQKADAPIAEYEGLPVQKGVGRFGPFLKWNSIFINVNKKYDFDNLTQANIEELIETKKQKDIDKIIHNWEEDGIRLEKARWGRFNIIYGKLKIELPKTTKAEKMTLEQVKEIISKKTKKKKTSRKKKK